MKEKKTVFLYDKKKKNFIWKSTYKKTDWETTFLGHHVELECWLEVFSSLGFEFHCIEVRFLFFVLEFKVTCYLMNEVDLCLLLSLCVLHEMQNQITQSNPHDYSEWYRHIQLSLDSLMLSHLCLGEPIRV